jgi:hypothetical protein
MWPVSFHRQPPCCLFVSTPDYGVYVAVQQETPPPFILTELKWDRDPAPNDEPLIHFAMRILQASSHKKGQLKLPFDLACTSGTS